jgi:riboflavin synthase
MFTGIVRAIGEVVQVSEGDGVRSFDIRVNGTLLQGVEVGSSISLDGACLTPVRVEGDEFRVEAVRPTLEKTIAGMYRVGSRINLERPLTLNGRIDGHLVQGHVDGLGYIRGVRKDGGSHCLEVQLPDEVMRYTVGQGSITLNGVSLTVTRVLPSGRIEVTVIPHTWEETNLRDLRPGDPVNVEGDLIGKYVGKLLDSGERGAGSAARE